MNTNILELIWHFNCFDVQINICIFLPVSGLVFLTFRLLWALKAQVSGHKSETMI